MNTKIAKLINATRHTECNIKMEFSVLCEKIVSAHNNAVWCGLIDLPLIELADVEVGETNTSVLIRPTCGCANINEIYSLKSQWGADDIFVFFGNESCIELVFNLK